MTYPVTKTPAANSVMIEAVATGKGSTTLFRAILFGAKKEQVTWDGVATFEVVEIAEAHTVKRALELINQF